MEWEALDLDDSDLPSLLRPCNQHRSISTASIPSPSSPPLPNHREHPDQPPSPSSSRRLPIPGPARAVHAAMLTKNLDRENRNFCDHDKGNDGLPSTQDYIRKAMDDTAAFDDDFSNHPWLSALQFLGAEDGLIPSTSISSIKKGFNGDKVDQVVAVVKSSTPNGLGGLLVSLKDPTGTIGASIHHKVLSQTEFGKELTIGAALILEKVAIFAPVRSAHYLNVTVRNLVKVFSPNRSSTSEQLKSVHPLQYADPGIGFCERARAVEKISSMQNLMQEDTEKRNLRTESSENAGVIQRQNLSTGRTQSNDRNLPKLTATKKGDTNLSQKVCHEGPNSMVGSRTTANMKGSFLEDAANTTSPLIESTSEKVQGTNEVQTQRQKPLMSTATLPRWTDEQLDELFANDEDDGSLF